jgi:hypothetical protein
MGFGEPFRVTPGGKVADWETWGLRPFLVSATCPEVGCRQYENGWRTRVGGDDIDLVRRVLRGEVDGYRRHAIEIPEANGWVTFVFEPGQFCLAVRRHQKHEERDPTSFRRGGDWRGATGTSRVYDRTDQWTDDLRTSTTRLADLRERHG